MIVQGLCPSRFSAVQDVLAQSLDQGDDLGAGVSVAIDGELLVDLRGGYRDRQKTAPFDDTLVCIYSVGKAVTAALVMKAVAAGHLEYDAPLATLWPEFGETGKSGITLAEALSHQAGLAAFTEEIDTALWLDHHAIAHRLAAMAPLWPPGTQNGYHPQTIGFIINEIMRRATGKMLGTHLRDMETDIHCGLTDENLARVGPMVKPPAPPDLGEITQLKKAAFLSKWSSAGGAPREAWIRAEIPSSNMHGTSGSLAQLMQLFVSDHHQVTKAIQNEALKERIQGDDLVLPFHLSWAAGLMKNTNHILGPSPTALGHYGFGGACVLVDPAHRLSFAYVPNKMSPALVADPRALLLLQVVYDAL